MSNHVTPLSCPIEALRQVMGNQNLSPTQISLILRSLNILPEPGENRWKVNSLKAIINLENGHLQIIQNREIVFDQPASELMLLATKLLDMREIKLKKEAETRKMPVKIDVRHANRLACVVNSCPRDFGPPQRCGAGQIVYYA